LIRKITRDEVDEFVTWSARRSSVLNVPHCTSSKPLSL
jgi:hypothetical protein